MSIYWMFLILSFITYIWSNSNYYLVKSGNHYEPRAFLRQGIPFFAVVIFFCGLRSGIADTVAYIGGFKDYPTSVAAIDWTMVEKDRGFYLISVLYKQFISSDYHGWLFLIALVSGIATMMALKKYSSAFGFSCYLFIATTAFSNLINGMRQYIVVSIFLWIGTDLVLRQKFVKYFILIALLSTIHGSAWVLLIVYFIKKIKPWTMKMWSMVVLSIGAGVFFDRILPLFGAVLDDTQYAGYVDYIATSGVGTNIIRIGVIAVPCVIAYLGKRVIQEQENELIDFMVNMSVVSFCISFISMFSSGMAIGRLAIYFDIFNLILLPWLIKYVFNEKSSKLITVACMGIYVIYFYFQMVITWNLNYVSDILNINIW